MNSTPLVTTYSFLKDPVILLAAAPSLAAVTSPPTNVASMPSSQFLGTTIVAHDAFANLQPIVQEANPPEIAAQEAGTQEVS